MQKGKIVYGGLAYLEAHKNMEKKAEESGIFIIKGPTEKSWAPTITNKSNFRPGEF